MQPTKPKYPYEYSPRVRDFVTKIPIRVEDGVWVTPCPYGVLVNPALDFVKECPCQGGELPERGSVAGAGSLTCKACTYFIQILDSQVICGYRLNKDEE